MSYPSKPVCVWGIPEGRGKITGWFPYGLSGPDYFKKLKLTVPIMVKIFSLGSKLVSYLTP